MEISWLQAALLGFFACLASMPGMGGTVIGNYTLGRPLVGGLVCGIILGDIQSGILIGTAMQVVYIALVTPGGTVSADVRAVSYIGIPLAMIAVNPWVLMQAARKVWLLQLRSVQWLVRSVRFCSTVRLQSTWLGSISAGKQLNAANSINYTW